jgi:hypothetical protein
MSVEAGTSLWLGSFQVTKWALERRQREMQTTLGLGCVQWSLTLEIHGHLHSRQNVGPRKTLHSHPRSCHWATALCFSLWIGNTGGFYFSNNSQQKTIFFTQGENGTMVDPQRLHSEKKNSQFSESTSVFIYFRVTVVYVCIYRKLANFLLICS